MTVGNRSSKAADRSVEIAKRFRGRLAQGSEWQRRTGDGTIGVRLLHDRDKTERKRFVASVLTRP